MQCLSHWTGDSHFFFCSLRSCVTLSLSEFPAQSWLVIYLALWGHGYEKEGDFL